MKRFFLLGILILAIISSVLLFLGQPVLDRGTGIAGDSISSGTVQKTVIEAQKIEVTPKSIREILKKQ